MRRISGISLILTAVAMIFGSLAFGDQAEKIIPPIIPSPEIAPPNRTLPQSREFSPLPEKGIQSVTAPGFYLPPEKAYALNFPMATDARKTDSSQFENDPPAGARSSYQSGKIPLTGNNFDPPAKFASSLAVGRYREENALSLTLDKFKEDDLFRNIAIFFELKLSF